MSNPKPKFVALSAFEGKVYLNSTGSSYYKCANGIMVNHTKNCDPDAWGASYFNTNVRLGMVNEELAKDLFSRVAGIGKKV